ncbi:hypothetical protein GCM10029964_090840 [Kibdelosporangium lantanae]
MDVTPNRSTDAVAHVVRAAVERAAAGDMDVLGDEGNFAIGFVLGVALTFRDAESQHHERQYFDLGADRAVAQAVPALVIPAMTTLLEAAGSSIDDVVEAGRAMAGKASLETRLYLARGCDVVWTAPCHGDPCIHRIALNWLVETARIAEIGPWDQHAQRWLTVEIVGDIAEHLQELAGDSIRIGALDAAIRGLGAAAVADHCCADDAATLLATLLDVERRAMIVQRERLDSGRPRGAHPRRRTGPARGLRTQR